MNPFWLFAGIGLWVATGDIFWVCWGIVLSLVSKE